MFVKSAQFNPVLLAAISGFVLAVPFLSYDLSLLVWFGFVPLLFAVDSAGTLKSLGLGFITGLIIFASGKYWIVEFIGLSKGIFGWRSWMLAGAYWAYCAVLLAVIAALYRWLRLRSNLAPIVLLPAVYTSVSSLFPMIFHLRFAETQIFNLLVIQGVDLFGAEGLDALIVAVNAAIFQLLKSLRGGNSKIRDSHPFTVIVVVIFTLAWFSYGYAQLAFQEKSNLNQQSLRVGIVQPNETPSIDDKPNNNGFSMSYPIEMELTKQLAERGADYVIWPEGRKKTYLDNPHVKSAFINQVKKMNIGLIFQDTETVRDSKSGKTLKQFNSAILIDGYARSHQRYDKMKLIPFRETVPLVSESKRLRPYAEEFIGRFLNELESGEKQSYFKRQGINLIPLICYETTFPRFVSSRVSQVAESGHEEDRDKEGRAGEVRTQDGRGTILIGLSNDGWFGSNHQPYQHVYGSILRSIENRLPFVHVANNGPSLVVSPSGRVLFSSKNAESGGFLVELVPGQSKYLTFYNRFPNALIYLCHALILLMMGIILIQWKNYPNKPFLHGLR